MGRAAFGLVAIILLVLTLTLDSPSTGSLGGWAANTVLTLGCSAVIALANKKYNFIPESHTTTAVALLLLLCINPITTAGLSTSTLLLFCHLLCLYILISTYEARNATKEFFIIATLPAIGAMFQYAFLALIPIYIGGGLLMKSFRVKEFIAFVFGLLAPYWIVMGLGIMSPFSFQWPDSLTVLSRGAVEEEIFLSLLTVGVMTVLGFILALYNGVRLFSRNSRLRCIHSTFNLTGAVAVLAIIFDFNNFLAYFGVLALWLAVQVALMIHLYNIRRPLIVLLILFCIFLPFYILAL